MSAFPSMSKPFEKSSKPLEASRRAPLRTRSRAAADDSRLAAVIARDRRWAAVVGGSDPRWAAVAARDRSADGTFYYSVETTGVYCRPSCGARLPRPENVRFHSTRAAAERAGFRPCKRCRPDRLSVRLPDGSSSADPQTAWVTAACRIIERADPAPTLAALARSVGVSPHHFHRVFKRVTGVTPRAYAAAQRERRVRDSLGVGRTVTDALFEAGYESSTAFYANAPQTLGMPPSTYRNGGSDAEIRFAVGECSLGSILVACSERGVCAILLGDDPDALVRDLQDRFSRARLIGGDAGFERLVAKVVGFVEAPRIGLDLPLDIRGTAFQRRVWQALQAIPPGSTASYGDIARRIGAPKAVRAVAGACASNALAVAIPCHRVVRTDGALSGYRWGIERKRELLEREAEQGGSVHGQRNAAKRNAAINGADKVERESE